jgi:hypothetical protein
MHYLVARKVPVTAVVTAYVLENPWKPPLSAWQSSETRSQPLAQRFASW